MRLADFALSSYFTKKISSPGSTVSFYPVEGYRAIVREPGTGVRKEIHGLEVTNKICYILDVGSRSMFVRKDVNLEVEIFDIGAPANPVLLFSDVRD